MLVVRRDEDIYRAGADWFEARWHFSFDGYRDPENMGPSSFHSALFTSVIAAINGTYFTHKKHIS